MLLLRPTESAVVFLQQLGRGLRLSPETGKSCLTVLDFIGQQHRRFRFDLRYRALLGCSRRQLQEQLTQGFPFLPPGCRLVLDRVASERVLANLRQCLPARRPQLLEELRALAAEGVLTPTSGLAQWLDALAMDPADFYATRGAFFTALRRELGWLTDAPHPEEERLSRAIGSALLHGDNPERLRALAAALSPPAPPELHTLGEPERRAWLMLTVQLFGTGRQWRPLEDALAVLWQGGAWRQELRQLLELLAARADHRLHPLPWALPVPLRRRALARIQPVRPAVRHPQEERSPLLPHHPLPRPGPRAVAVPLGKPEHHHRRLANGAAVSPPRGAGVAGALVRAPAAAGGRRHRAVPMSGLCHLRGPPRRTPDGDSLAVGAGDSGGVDARLL